MLSGDVYICPPLGVQRLPVTLDKPNCAVSKTAPPLSEKLIFNTEKRRPVQRYDWKRLNNQQVGAFTEYYVKMERTMYGFQVFTTEVDDRGIDFVARYETQPFIEVQVKSLRSMGYVFMQKSKFVINDSLYLAFGLLTQDNLPELYLIPSTVWLSPNAVFVERNYDGLKSKPEWGLNVSKRNMAFLEPYKFEKTVFQLTNLQG